MIDAMNPKRFQWTALAWLSYVIAFPILHETVMNDMAAVLMLVPLVTTSWWFGLRGALVGFLLMLPTQAALFLLGDHSLGWDMFVGIEGLIGISGLGATAAICGYLADRMRGAEQAVSDRNLFVAEVSHEIRNPLTGVIGLTDTLLAQWDELGPGEARELVALVSTEAHAIEAIVGDLVEISRLSAGIVNLDRVPVDLGELARRIDPNTTGDALVIGDADRIGQIIRNLVVNASRHGGPELRLQVVTHAAGGVVEVRDNGVGVDPAVEPTMFVPFVTSGGANSAGLGLAVSHQLAMAMGGDLSYARRDGWTVFSLTLPLDHAVVSPPVPSV